ncbi:glycosyltransferase [Vogesella sp. LIG4]|uniref:glycosyltransferase n=1 Tax=Vogesella sp. LIG4 TaxID=1192162 RepID=UPI00081FF9CD|nr:glycosyltransferase [Vogesella sp. LIG4]SCK09343.1 Glycosyltransferase involved in cell wall bisynthesis [Vogesella sp. LIG4]
MTITILTPTFNDEVHLSSLIHSVLSQDYTEWQWIIINDGSTDNTHFRLNKLADSRIKVIHQSNTDQLNALLAAVPFIMGEFICLMHSDDYFVSNTTLREVADRLHHLKCDGVYADYKLIDKNGNDSGFLHVPTQLNTKISRKIMIGMGGNPIGDPFFVRRNAFFSHVLPNYIKQNTIYYLNYFNLKPLYLQKIEPWYCYRVFDENYIHSDIGKFVALSGQFRTTSRILAAGFDFSGNTAWGYCFFRIFRKISITPPNILKVPCELGAFQYFIYWAKDLERYGYPEILIDMARAIGKSFKSKNKKQHKCLKIVLSRELEYTPADARQFYKDHIKGNVPEIYYSLIKSDYDYIEVKSYEEKIKLQKILDFLSLQYFIAINSP